MNSNNESTLPQDTNGDLHQAQVADDSVILAQQEFKDTAEEHGRAAALPVFNSRVSAWANKFSDRRMQRFAYILGSRMDGASHGQRIGQDKLREWYLKQYGRPMSRTTLWRRIRELEEAGVIQVTREKQDEGGYNPGMQCRSVYLVNFGRVLVHGQAEPHDFLRGDGGRSQNETQVETQPETQVETLKHSSTTPDNSVLPLKQDQESLSQKKDVLSLDEVLNGSDTEMGRRPESIRYDSGPEHVTQTTGPYCNDYWAGYDKRGRFRFTRMDKRLQRDGEVMVSLSTADSIMFWDKDLTYFDRQMLMERLAQREGLQRDLPGVYGG